MILNCEVWFFLKIFKMARNFEVGKKSWIGFLEHFGAAITDWMRYRNSAYRL